MQSCVSRGLMASFKNSPMGPCFSQQRTSVKGLGSAGTATTVGINHADRCVGALIWKAAGDALGAAVEGLDSLAIHHKYSRGITAFISTGRGYGSYTDDTQMAVALARSLIEQGHVDPGHAAAAYAADFDPFRGYGGTAVKILHALKNDGADWRTIATQFIPAGSFANGGAMRIAPVGLAYRSADVHVLRQAVTDALACTHVHPVAIDGALVQAAAVAWLCQQPTPSVPVPKREQAKFMGALLSHLLGVATTDGMRAKLQQLQQVTEKLYSSSGMEPLPMDVDGQGAGSAATAGQDGSDLQPPHNAPRPDPTPFNTAEAQVPTEGQGSAEGEGRLGERLAARWLSFQGSAAWKDELEVATELAGGQFQIRADDAVACVLCAFVHHGLSDMPASAVVAAVHYGGDTDTIAAMAGALVGALYGTKHLPPGWWENLEYGPKGRDEVVALGKQLAELSVTK